MFEDKGAERRGEKGGSKERGDVQKFGFLQVENGRHEGVNDSLTSSRL
jgi:hypothetical protein